MACGLAGGGHQGGEYISRLVLAVEGKGGGGGKGAARKSHGPQCLYPSANVPRPRRRCLPPLFTLA